MLGCSLQGHWDFLDERKLAPNEPLTKAKYLKHTNTGIPDAESGDIARSSKVSTRKVIIM